MYYLNSTKKKMQKFYYLLNHEVRMLSKYVFPILILLLILQNFIFLITVNKTKNQYLRFEELLSISGVQYIFMIIIVLFTLIGPLSFILNSYQSKSIYTLMALSQKRKNIYLTKLFASFSYYVLLIATEILSILLCYQTYRASTYSIDKLHNDLILAFSRMNFLRIVFPNNIFNLLLWIFTLFTVCNISISTFLAISNKKRFPLFISASFLIFLLAGSLLPLYKSNVNLYVFLSVTILVNISLGYFSTTTLEINREVI